MAEPHELGGIVLAGGESRRMGSAKAWLSFGGAPMLAHVARRVLEVTPSVVVVAAVGQALPPLPAGVAVVRDSAPSRGPLQGIADGLHALAERGAVAAFVSGVDTPLLEPALVRRLAALQGGATAVVPRVGGRKHPLCSIVAVSALAEARAMLAEGDLAVTHLFDRLGAAVVDAAVLLEDPELARLDPELRSLRNLNTPEEYEAALREALALAPR